jgi:hypothetical protein
MMRRGATVATEQPQPGQPPVAAGSVQSDSINIVTQAANPEQMARFDDQLEKQGAALQNIADSCVELQRLAKVMEGLGNLMEVVRVEQDVARVKQRLMIPPQVPAVEGRRLFLRYVYRYLFDEAAEGEWVVLPEEPQPGDHVKIVGVPDDDDYQDMIGIWHGLGRNVEFSVNAGKKNRQFSMLEVAVVVEK